jgi:DNA-binding response OmpR family regulator
MKARILMIDDDREMCLEFSEVLKDSGYEVQTVFDGESGLARLYSEPFDLLLLDMKMPGMNGLEVLQQLRKSGNRIKVLVLSGRPFTHTLASRRADQDDLDIILKLADNVINKPFNVDEVLGCIETLLRKN